MLQQRPIAVAVAEQELVQVVKKDTKYSKKLEIFCLPKKPKWRFCYTMYYAKKAKMAL